MLAPRSNAKIIISLHQLLHTSQGSRIKIQANYECLQARYSCIAQGGMRAKPDMKPWVSTDKSKMSSFRSGTNNASIGALALGLCRPYGAQKNGYQCLPRACALGCSGVSPLQGSSTFSPLINYFVVLIRLPYASLHTEQDSTKNKKSRAPKGVDSFRPKTNHIKRLHYDLSHSAPLLVIAFCDSFVENKTLKPQPYILFTSS